MGYNSEDLANQIFKDLVGTSNAALPDLDLYASEFEIPWDETHPVYQPVASVSVETLTERKVGGNGVFDALMAGVDAHLQREFQANRITGAKFADAYVALTAAAMQSAVQFALGKDQAQWLAIRSQADAVTARTQNEVVRLEAMLRRANYALTKLKLATEDTAYGAQLFQVTNILPQQERMLKEQVEAQHAQTSDSLTSGGAVGGLLGKQKELYGQQVESYAKDMKLKAIKMFMDNWTAQKTINEATPPNPYFSNQTDVLDKVFEEAQKIAVDTAESIPFGTIRPTPQT